MRHDPGVPRSAWEARRVTAPAAARPSPALLLEELERRCAGWKVRPAGEHVDALFLHLDRFATLASDLIDGLALPAGIDPPMRPAFDSAYAALETAFSEAEAVPATIVERRLRGEANDRAIEHAIGLIAMLSPIRADAAALYERLAADVRALLYAGARRRPSPPLMANAARFRLPWQG